MRGWIAHYREDLQLETGYPISDRARYQRHVAPGDLVFFRNAQRLTAIARIATVETASVPKRTEHCPQCGVGDIKLRRTRALPYRCIRGHKFQLPTVTVGTGQESHAFFGGDVIEVQAKISTAELRSFELTNCRQLHFRPCDADGLVRYTWRRDHKVAKTIRHWLSDNAATLVDSDADDTGERDIVNPREHRLHAIRLRRGLQEVRDELLRTSGRCAISGCTIRTLLEVACIHGITRHRNPSNAILLRSDLHTLFDLDLIGIDPDRLVVVLHPDLAGSTYMEFHGASLTVPVGGARRRALAARWAEFSGEETGRSVSAAATPTRIKAAIPARSALASSPGAANNRL